MKIITLLENTTREPSLAAEHGLSVYIETARHHILADTGASDRTWENARALGVDLSAIDIVMLSHGHWDHSGGIMGFNAYNKTANIYMRPSAFNDYRHDERYIGIDPAIRALPSVRFTESVHRLDSEISFFSDITGDRFRPKSNAVLSEKIDGVLTPDRFRHEQCMVIESENKTVLISGCAHNGILNILDRFREIYRRDPDIVISGFHMMKSSPYEPDEIAVIRETARELAAMNTVFYTGHCTSQPAYDLMRPLMPNLRPIYSGCVIL